MRRTHRDDVEMFNVEMSKRGRLRISFRIIVHQPASVTLAKSTASRRHSHLLELSRIIMSEYINLRNLRPQKEIKNTTKNLELI